MPPTPPFVTPQQLSAAHQWRYAVKAFDPEAKLTDDQRHALAHTLQAAPSSYGLQSWHFVFVTDPEVKAELQPHSWNQPQITQCDTLIVLCRKTQIDETSTTEYMERISEVRGDSLESLDGFAGMINTNVMSQSATAKATHADHQVYLAMGFVLHAAAMLGVDSCPMEGITPAEYDRILNLTDQGYATVLALPVGIRSVDDPYLAKAKVRFPLDDVVQFV